MGATRAGSGLRALAGVLTALGVLGCFGVSRVAAQQATIPDLAWMAGSWTTGSGRQTIEEHWVEPSSNALIGVGRTLAEGRMVFFEFLRIEARTDGIVYIAQPRGAPPTEFRLTKWDGRTAMFENPQHDFPKRVAYTKNDDGSMTARIDGGEGVQQGAQSFPYRRRTSR